MMVDDVYEKLAQKLDAWPSGYPRTDTGIELKSLRKRQRIAGFL
jgi:hypothetical protein